MTDVQWEDPPAQVSGPGAPQKWMRLLAPLVERPGDWARVQTSDNKLKAQGLASRIRAGSMRLPPGGWDAVARGIGNGDWGIWVRYMGPETNGQAH